MIGELKMSTLTFEEYTAFHSSLLQPLDMKINVELFEKEMYDYRYAFRRWGTNHLEYPRYGAPLVNMNGEMHNNPEPTCYPLDQWNATIPEEEKIFDKNVKTPTELLSSSCFDVLDSVKPFMLRSCILKWGETGHFKPHSDTWMPSDIIRLWGTNDPDNMILRFHKDLTYARPNEVKPNIEDEMGDRVEGIEAGRLYVIDTHVIHDARATADNVYQFFISLNADSMQTLKELL